MSFHNLLMYILLDYYNMNIIKTIYVMLCNAAGVGKGEEDIVSTETMSSGMERVRRASFHWKRSSGGWRGQGGHRFMRNDVEGDGKGDEGTISLETMQHGVERARRTSFHEKQCRWGWKGQGGHCFVGSDAAGVCVTQ
jgi:hypothetical protein